MRRRCLAPKRSYWKWYGGRGITICPEWDDFAVFAADMGPHPGKGWSLDREKGDKNYNKDNCRWATAVTQARNRRGIKLTASVAEEIRQRYIRFSYRQSNATALAKEFGVERSMVQRIVAGTKWAA